MRYIDGDETTVAACERHENRDAVEALRTRAHLLAGKDRALLEMYLEHGDSLRQIGRLMGLDPRNVGRRIRRILRRLTDNTYKICLGNHDDFNGRELTVIKDYFIGGLPARRISRNRDITLYRVNMILQRARTYAASKRRENP